MEFRTIFPADCYSKGANGLYTDLRTTQEGLKLLYGNDDYSTPIKITGIIRPNEDATGGMLSGSIAYTHKLTEYVMAHAVDSAVVQDQQANPSKDIFTGLPFKANTGKLTAAEKKAEFTAYVNSLTQAQKADIYVKMMSIPSEEQLKGMLAEPLSKDIATMKSTVAQATATQTGMSAEEITAYLEKMPEEDIVETYTQIVTAMAKMQYAAGVKAQMAAMPAAQLEMALTAGMNTYTDEQFAVYYDEVLEFAETTYEENLIELGYVTLDDPASINIYASSFENKDIIEEVIADYNADKEELQQITYTDYVGLMMSSITTIINAITYVLIAFVAISLVVSSIMIGVITLISVQERTKEIGILRAIGASKRNVSSMFNAETVIIGFTSGLLGVGITYALCIPINLILNALTDIQNLKAILPIEAALILIGISVVLTLFAGIIPSRSAAKKDPVVAQRTE